MTKRPPPEFSETGALVDRDAIQIIYMFSPVPNGRTNDIISRPYAGETVESIMRQVVHHGATENPDLRIFVYSNDQRLTRKEWDTFVPDGGSTLIITVLPQSFILAPLLAQIGITAGTALSNILIAGITAGSLLGLNFLLGSIEQSRRQALLDGSRPGSPAFLLTGVKNEARPFEPVPRVYGSYRYLPPLASRTLTEEAAESGTQDLKQLFCLGFGPLELRAAASGIVVTSGTGTYATDIFQIGDTDFDEFDGAQAETFMTDADTEFAFFPNRTIAHPPPSTNEYVLRDELPDIIANRGSLYPPFEDYESAIPWTIPLETTDNCIEIQTSFLFPNGLANLTTDNGLQPWGSFVQVQYRASGDVDWIGSPHNPQQVGFQQVFDGERYEPSTYRKTKEPFYVKHNFAVPEGKYEVRARLHPSPLYYIGGTDELWPRDRGGAGTETYGLFSDAQWVAFNSVEPGSARDNFPSGLVITGIKVTGTDILEGEIDNFSAEVVSVLPTITSSGTIGPAEATRNPAYEALDVLRGSANALPIPDSKIDLLRFREWAEFCEREGLRCDIVFDFESNVFEAFNTIARVGRGTLSFNGDLFSVVFDDADQTPVQMFTPRNSSNFQSVKTFPEEIHAVRGRFPNREKSFRADEVVIYSDGYSEANATKYASVDEILGITTVSGLEKHMKYEELVTRYRSEIYSLDTGLDGLVAHKGDVVRVRNDIVLIGLGQGIVTSTETNGSGDITAISLDEEQTLTSGTEYAIEARHNEDTSFQSSAVVNTAPAEETITTGTLQFPVPVQSGSITPGDMVSFGEADRVDALMKITGIQRTGDFSATISMVDAAPQIFATLSGLTYTGTLGNISIPAGLDTLAPPAPVHGSTSYQMLDLDSDGVAEAKVSVLLLSGSGTNRARTSGFRSRWREVHQVVSGTDSLLLPEGGGQTYGNWVSLPDVPAVNGFIVIPNVRDVYAFELQAWAVSARGVRSDKPVTVSGSVSDLSSAHIVGLNLKPFVVNDQTGARVDLRVTWDLDAPRSSEKYLVKWRGRPGMPSRFGWEHSEYVTSDEFIIEDIYPSLWRVAVTPIAFSGQAGVQVEGRIKVTDQTFGQLPQVTGLEVESG